MKMSGNTVLITGGATGIGYALAKYFNAHNNTVIICGRRQDRLDQAARELPGIRTISCDVASPEDRIVLFRKIRDDFPEFNVLINNAGIQRDIDLTQGIDDLGHGEDEIAVNFEAPIFLSALLTPLLKDKDNAAIINVSSGLAFMVGHATRSPVYCATKAAIHAFSIAQREQLAAIGITVIEVIPPMVESELNMASRIKRGALTADDLPWMLKADDFVAQVTDKMEQGETEIRLPMEHH